MAFKMKGFTPFQQNIPGANEAAKKYASTEIGSLEQKLNRLLAANNGEHNEETTKLEKQLNALRKAKINK
tara:strand:+ start:233 stop:442 length:210 start_codon:yes stop_codon:yes gene_type:complete